MIEGQIPIGNVFDNNRDRDAVPVKMIVDGKEITVGQAHLTDTGDGIHVAMDLKTDNPNDVIELFSTGITGYSLAAKPDVGPKHHSLEANAPVQHRMSDEEMMERLGVPDHEHVPRQHRDGKPPWCGICRLTDDFRVPEAQFNFGKPSLPIHKRSN